MAAVKRKNFSSNEHLDKLNKTTTSSQMGANGDYDESEELNMMMMKDSGSSKQQEFSDLDDDVVDDNMMNAAAYKSKHNHNQQQQHARHNNGDMHQQDEEKASSKAATTRHPKPTQFENFDQEQASMTKASVESCTGDEELNEIDCYLETDDLWKKFHELGTEMIITKSGRRMFPPLRVSFTGAKITQKYVIAMDIVPTDNKRYRYAYHRSSWLVAGKADPPVQPRMFIHPDGPFTGETLYKQIVSFEKVKLTNNEMDKSGHVS